MQTYSTITVQYSVPVLLYATEVLPITKTDISMLNHLVDRAVYRIYGCTSGEDIQFVQSVLDLPCLGACIKKIFAGFLNSFSHSFSWDAMLNCVI